MAKDFKSYFQAIRDLAWRNDDPMDWTRATISMTHEEEKRMLYTLVKEYPRQIETIIDAGCFLGASTLSFGIALEEREWARGGGELHDRPVFSYDLFLNDSFGRALIRRKTGKRTQDHDNLLPFFLHTVGDKLRYCNVVAGDVCDFPWTPERKIDILFLDLLKMSRINDFCVENFFPALVPGESVVIQQDYLHEYVPWIPITMKLMEEWFDFLGFCQSSAIYAVQKPISAEDCSRIVETMAAMTIQEKVAVIAAAQDPIHPPGQKAMLELSKLWCCMQADELDYFDEVMAQFPEELKELAWVTERLRVLNNRRAAAG